MPVQIKTSFALLKYTLHYKNISKKRAAQNTILLSMYTSYTYKK